MADDSVVNAGAIHRAQKGGSQGAAPVSAGDRGATIERILDSAEAVLQQHGYAGFTTRRVAEAAAIAPGNLSYHFPSKLELLRALIKRVVSRYSDRLQAALEESPLAPGADLPALVRWLMQDAAADETVRLYRELWAMSLHDEVVREAVDDLYDEIMGHVATALQRARPNADPQAIRDLVQFLALVSEGTTVLYGTRQDRVSSLDRMIDLSVKMIGVIVPELAPAPDPARVPRSPTEEKLPRGT